jgi:hypothetical protein
VDTLRSKRSTEKLAAPTVKSSSIASSGVPTSTSRALRILLTSAHEPSINMPVHSHINSSPTDDHGFHHKLLTTKYKYDNQWAYNSIITNESSNGDNTFMSSVDELSPSLLELPDPEPSS